MVKLGLSIEVLGLSAWYAQIKSLSCIWLSWLKYFNKLVCHARRKCTYAGCGSTQTLQTNSLPNPCSFNWNYPGPAVWDSKRVPKVTLAFIMESKKSKPFNTIYTPEKLTYPPKTDYFNKNYIFQPWIFRGHFRFPRGYCYKIKKTNWKQNCAPQNQGLDPK